MKNNLLRFVLFFSLLYSSQFLSGQCIHGVGTFADTFDTGPGSSRSNWILSGQTFIATSTGNITSISIGLGSATTAGTHELRIGSSANPPTSVIGGAVYQTFTTSGGAETVTINLSTPFAVTSGLVYAFDITFDSSAGTIVDLQYSGDNPDDYSDGVAYYDNSGFGVSNGSRDIDFAVSIDSAACPVPSTDVPTLSEWGLIVLALLLMTLGTLYLVQPNWRRRFEQELID